MIQHILDIQGGVDQAAEPENSIQLRRRGLFLNVLFQATKPCVIALPG
jgi:hypothetical protein